jgi:hypothetical protein
MQKWRSTADDRRKRIVSIKKQMGGKCFFCGFDKNFAALDFHHIDPSKKSFSVNSAAKGTRDELIKEAEKCILLCRNCHSSLHSPDMDAANWPDAPTTIVAICTHPPTPIDWPQFFKDLAKEMSDPSYIRPEWLPEEMMWEFIAEQNALDTPQSPLL